jgi:hypothetical protein
MHDRRQGAMEGPLVTLFRPDLGQDNPTRFICPLSSRVHKVDAVL